MCSWDPCPAFDALSSPVALCPLGWGQHVCEGPQTPGVALTLAPRGSLVGTGRGCGPSDGVGSSIEDPVLVGPHAWEQRLAQSTSPGGTALQLQAQASGHLPVLMASLLAREAS